MRLLAAVMLPGAAAAVQLQPLVEASGAVHGDQIAGGKFCSPLPGSSVQPVLAVLEAASLSVSLLAGPTPYLTRRLTPANSSVLHGSVVAFVAVDLDVDGRDELVIGTSNGHLAVLQISADCSSIAVAPTLLSVCTALPCSLATLLPVPGAVAPARLVAVRATGRQPFALLGHAPGAPLHLTLHGSTDFTITPTEQSWVAAAASSNFSQLLLLRAHSAVLVALDATTGRPTVVGQHNASSQAAGGGIATAPWRSVGVVDFAGDGRNVAVLVDNSTTPHATMLAIPSLRVLGGGLDPRQQLDSNYSWGSVAVASLSDAYGADTTQRATTAAAAAPSQGVGMQQLIGLRSFAQLPSCPPYRGHAFGDEVTGVFCCRTNANNSCLSGNWNFGRDATAPSDIPCCLRPGSKHGCGYADVRTLVYSLSPWRFTLAIYPGDLCVVETVAG